MIKANKIAKRYASYIFSDERINRKLINAFEKICEDEGVELKYFENCESLNNYRGVYDKEKFAAGVYQFTRFVNTGKISNEDSKRILLSKNKGSFSLINCFTFAHELGHHFGIKYNNDDSEETADSYVSWLCEKNLNGFEFNRIKAYTKIYEGYDIAYNKREYEKLKSEGKTKILFYSDVQNFATKEFKFRNFLLQNTVKEIKRRRKLKNPKKPIIQRFFDFFNSFNKF